jgi:hypothetical protein
MIACRKALAEHHESALENVSVALERLSVKCQNIARSLRDDPPQTAGPALPPPEAHSPKK